MEIMKKAVAFFLCVLMTAALGITAFAEDTTGTTKNGSITIDNAVKDQTYSAYQILYLESYNNTTDTAYAYKATTEWKGFIESTNIKGTYVNVDRQGYVTWIKKDSNGNVEGAQDFAKLAKAWADEKKITATKSGKPTADSEEKYKITFSELSLGYYLVDSTLGTLCSLDTAAPDVTMQEKNSIPENEKKVQEGNNWVDSNDANIGDTISFKSTITAKAGAENYVFHDKMSSGLTFNSSSVEVTKAQSTVAATNYTLVTAATELTDGCTFEIKFTEGFCNSLQKDDEIVITYNAVLNTNAVIASKGQTNKSHLSYGDESNTDHNKTPDDETTTKTWNFKVLKYTTKNSEEVALSGATFKLSTDREGEKTISLVSRGDNVYRKAVESDAATTKKKNIATDASGTFEIQGLDSGTYYLTETKQPDGYNKLAGPVEIKIDSNGEVYVVNGDNSTKYTNKTVKVENQTGLELPETGSIGTTIFYIVGGLLMTGAAVLLITKKRMGTK